MSQAVAILRSVGGLVFDATFNEQHQSDLTVTDNPVETGVKVSDHAYMEPATVTISAGVSDTPLTLPAADPFAATVSRSKQAYTLLKELQRAAEPFDVQTGLQLYSNMVCTSIRTEQDKDTCQVLAFTATLREVIIVNTQVVSFPKRAGATKRQADPTKKNGEQQGGTVKATKQSLLKKALGAFR